MKLEYTTRDGRMTVTLEGSTQKDVWRELSRFQEVFENDAEANIDGKTLVADDVRFRVRKGQYTDEKGKDKTAEYFEKVVGSGPLKWYKKQFGILDDGTDGLFPKWQVPDGHKAGLNGWSKFVKDSSNQSNETKAKTEVEGDVPF